MILHPLSVVTMLAAGLAGAHLYQTKHQVAQLDKELREVARQIEETEKRTQVLRASWAQLNEPGRLRQVVQSTMPLEPMQPSQFVRLAELERRLPPAQPLDRSEPSLFGAPAPATLPAEAIALLPPAPARLVAVAAAAIPAPGSAAAAVLPVPPVPAAVVAPIEPAAEDLPLPTPLQLLPVVAEARPAVVRPVAVRPAVPPPAAAAAVPAAHAPAAVPRPAEPVRIAAPAPRAGAPEPALGSVLGGAARMQLAPPVPFGTAQAAPLPAGGLR